MHDTVWRYRDDKLFTLLASVIGQDHLMIIWITGIINMEIIHVVGVEIL